MAQRRKDAPIRQFTMRFRRQEPTESDFHRLEEKRRSLAAATQQWLSLLRDMERSGESSEPRYETYFRAYVEAKQQEKRAELELFNMRQGLVR